MDSLLWSHEIMRKAAIVLLVLSVMVSTGFLVYSFGMAERKGMTGDAILLQDGEVTFARRLEQDDPEMVRIRHDFFSVPETQETVNIPQLDD